MEAKIEIVLATSRLALSGLMASVYIETQETDRRQLNRDNII